MKQFLLITAVAFITGFTYLVATQPAQATYPWQICGEGEHIGNPHCIPSITEVSPTEEVVPTVEPTLEVIETPTASPTADVVQTTQGTHVDVSDGKSDGRHTAPDGLGCAAHPCIPSGAPAAGHGL